MDGVSKNVLFLRVGIIVIDVMAYTDVLSGHNVQRRTAYYYEGYLPYGESYHITEWYSQPPPPLPPPPPPPPLLLLSTPPFFWGGYNVYAPNFHHRRRIRPLLI